MPFTTPRLALNRCRALPRSAIAVALLVSTFALSTPSTAVADTTFRITGRGWGHGIGMSQWGARGYADPGGSYRHDAGWILEHYYQGTGLGTKSSVTVKVDLDDGKIAHGSWRVASGDSNPLVIVDAASSTNVFKGTATDSYYLKPYSYNSAGTTKYGMRVYSVKTTATGVTLGTLLKSFSGLCYARSTPSASTSLVKIVDKSGPFSSDNIVWRGYVRFFTKAPSGTVKVPTVNAVNFLPMEYYLRGVVPREMPSSWYWESSTGSWVTGGKTYNIEALKAQAIAARSYAYGPASSGATLYCTTRSQVYGGYKRGTNLYEAASTNAAVSQTAGKVVTYGTTVVTTFFCSSSGGGTADIEDVWVPDDYSVWAAGNAANAKAYYRGVADADQADPNYAWTPVNLTGAQIAAKIRDLDNGPSNTDPLDYSAPWPAAVTGFAYDRAESSHVAYVTVKWSNGYSKRIKGTVLQAALGLKSTKYWIAAINVPFGTRYQETDSRVTYTGRWTSYKNSRLSGGSYRYAPKGADATFSFKGTGFRWYSFKYPGNGRAAVYLDGVSQATVSLYSSKATYNAAIWTKTGLSADSTHTVVVRVLGTKDSAAKGTNVGVDAVEVAGGTLVQAPVPPPVTTIQENNPAIAYGGPWTTYSSAKLSGGAYKYARTADSSATLTFTGTRIKIVSLSYVGSGKATVQIDGMTKTIDQYSSTTQFRKVVFDSGALPAGTHVLKFAPTGTSRAGALGTAVGIDALLITAGGPVG
jgi:peptidoglycan hydrolase-like amidase